MTNTIFGLRILGDDEPREYCEKCGGAKFYEMMFPVAEGVRELVTFKTMCECESEASLQAEILAKQKMFAYKVKDLRMAGIPDEEYQNATFENDDSPDSRASKIARKYFEHWDRMFDENHGIIFSGDVGTGKSYLACCIANAIIDTGQKVHLTNFARILTQAQQRDFKDYLWELNSSALLVIDDIGTERKTDYASEIVFQVIDDRYKSEKPLIVTTNMAVDDLMKSENLTLVRAYERILSMCTIHVPMTGESRRRKQMAERAKQARDILRG